MILLRAWSAHASQLVNTADCGKWIATAGHGWATAILATCFPCLRDPAYQCRIERRKALTAQTPALVSRITVANMTSRRALVTIVTQLLVWVLSGHKLVRVMCRLIMIAKPSPARGMNSNQSEIQFVGTRRLEIGSG
jgi:hypothetical protein